MFGCRVETDLYVKVEKEVCGYHSSVQQRFTCHEERMKNGIQGQRFSCSLEYLSGFFKKLTYQMLVGTREIGTCTQNHQSLEQNSSIYTFSSGITFPSVDIVSSVYFVPFSQNQCHDRAGRAASSSPPLRVNLCLIRSEIATLGSLTS